MFEKQQKSEQTNSGLDLELDPHKKELTNLKWTIEQQKIRKVEKLSSWRVRLPYYWKWEKRDFILENNSNNTASIWVKKMW